MAAKRAMKKAMKSSMKRRRAARKGGKKKSGMKKRRAMKVSQIAKGKHAKSSVFRGTKVKTVGGLKKSDLIKNKWGKVVSRKQSLASKKRNGSRFIKWGAAVQKARKALNIKGFQAVGGKTARGKALLAKTRSFFKK